MRKLVVSDYHEDGSFRPPGRGRGPRQRIRARRLDATLLARRHRQVLPDFIKEVDACARRRTYVTHAEAFGKEPGNPFGDAMNAPAKYVLSRTWRNRSGATRDHP